MTGRAGAAAGAGALAGAGADRWRLEIVAPGDRLEPLLDLLDEGAEAVSWFATGATGAAGATGAGGAGGWRVEAIYEDEVAARSAATRARDTGLVGGGATVGPLAGRDWLARNRRSFRPIRAGRFLVRPTTWQGPAPTGGVVLHLDAGPAFGSGSHETTRGCLLAMDRLARRRVRPGCVLDMGCGSGILAIAAARRWRVPVLAVDIDPVATATTAENAARNGVARLVRTATGDGWRTAAVRRDGPFDLVMANILAAPLRRMAPDLARGLAPGGEAVLSGLLRGQASAVAGACRAAGLAVAGRLILGDWAVLVVTRPSGSRA